MDGNATEEIFTSSGAGKLNMVDFFRDMSHGKLDLSGSQVFGWYTLDKKISEYTDDKEGRNKLLEWAREKAVADGKDLSKFFSVVVCTMSDWSLGGIGGAASDDDRTRWGNGMSSLSPSILGQEMGHTYGLSHSRAFGSTTDYEDPWDIMSTARHRTTMAPHPYFTDKDARETHISTWSWTKCCEHVEPRLAR